jgi:hypothetical protein
MKDLPGYLNKIAGIRALQEHWLCPKQMAKCFGVHCFIDKDSVHEMLNCWAMCIVSVCFSSCVHTNLSILQLNHDGIASLASGKTFFANSA